MERPKKTPTRTCVACRRVDDKRRLLRVVRTPEGAIGFDPTGKRNGRGAYVCPNMACVGGMLASGRLAGALRSELAPDEAEALARQLEEECSAKTGEVVR